MAPIAGVVVEVDGRDSGKTIELPAGPTGDITNEVLPEDFPRRANMEFVQAFIEIDGLRYAIDYAGVKDGKIYYALAGGDLLDGMLVTSVADASSKVYLSFKDKTEPMTVTVDVGGNGTVAAEDTYSVVGLDAKELEAHDGGATGSFEITPGATRTFMVKKQVAQQISISAQSGQVSKVSGDDVEDDVQLWTYTAPEQGGTDTISVTASGLSRNGIKVSATMDLPTETTGGGVDSNRPDTNRMYGNAELAGYVLDPGVEVTSWGGGKNTDFTEYAKNQTPGLALGASGQLSASQRKFLEKRGNAYGDNGAASGDGLSASVDVNFDRTNGSGSTVLIDMLSTRCTPGNQGWSSQLSGIVVNDVAVPLKGFDFSTVDLNSGTSLDARVGDWVTLTGDAKGTKVRVVGLGAWTDGAKVSGLTQLSEREFHHYIVEVRNVTGPVDVKGIYTTTANYRALNVGSYGVDTELFTQVENDNSKTQWTKMDIGSSVQSKNMVTMAGGTGQSDMRIMAKKGYTLEGAKVFALDTSNNVVNLPLRSEWIAAYNKNSSRTVVSAPPDNSIMGYTYFYSQGTLVNYKLHYKSSGGTYLEEPVDANPYNVENLSTFTVAPQIPYKEENGVSQIFTGYKLYEGDYPWDGGSAATDLGKTVMPGESVDLSTLNLKDAQSATRDISLVAQWKSPANTGHTVTAQVKFELQDGAGSVEKTLTKNVTLAKGTDYEFVNIPDSVEVDGTTYYLDRDKSDLKPGTASSNDGQTIGTAVYARFAPGVLDGAANLHGKKVVTGDGAPNLREGDFSFSLTNVKAPAGVTAPMPDQSTVSNDAQGAFHFGDIAFSAPGEYVYEIAEVPNGLGNFEYDTHKLTLTIDVSMPDTPGGSLKVALAKEEGGRTFTNVYRKPAPQPATLDGETQLQGTKTLTGEGNPGLKGGDFSFAISAVSAPAGQTAPLPADTVVENDAQGAFHFGDITFTAPGEYVYEVAEVAGTDAEIGYDTARFPLKVTVSEPVPDDPYDPQGAAYELKVEGANSFAFKNTYTALPDYTPTVLSGIASGTKTLSGKTIADGQFGFAIAAASQGAPLPTSTVVRNAADGTYAFGDIVYRAPGTYVYTVSEVDEGAPYYEYDKHTATITVEVTDDPAVKNDPLVAKVAKVEGSLDFANVYHKPDPQPGVLDGERYLAGTKTLTGSQAPALAGGEFSFSIAAVSAPAGVMAPMPDQSTVSNDAQGAFHFGDIAFTAPGEYVYEVSEAAGANEDIVYDDTVHTVKVTVSEPAVDGDPYDVAVESAPLAFVNVFAPVFKPGVMPDTTGAVSLEGERAPALAGGEFLFTMKRTSAPEGAAEAEELRVRNAADGSFSFAGMQLSVPGTYVYEVTQVAGTDERIAYDTHVATVEAVVSEPDLSTRSDAAYQVDVRVQGSLSFVNAFDAGDGGSGDGGAGQGDGAHEPEQPSGDGGNAGSLFATTGDSSKAVVFAAIALSALAGALIAAVGLRSRRDRR